MVQDQTLTPNLTKAKQLTRLWFVLLIFNVFLHLDFVEAWADKIQNFSAESEIVQLTCAEDRSIDVEDSSDSSVVAVFSGGFGLQSFDDLDGVNFPHKKFVELSKTDHLTVIYKSPFIKIVTVLSGRSPPIV